MKREEILALLNGRDVETEVADLEEEVGGLMKENQGMPVPTPEGDFSLQGLKVLTNGLNKVLPLFGLPTIAEPSEPLKILPMELAKFIAMVQSAVDDAIAAEIIPPELSFRIEDIQSDAELNTIGSVLSTLAKNKDFKMFLKEGVEEPEIKTKVEVEVEKEPAEISDDELMKMAMSRKPMR